MATQALEDYLQRYVNKPSGGGDGGKAKLKKKKKKRNDKNKGSDCGGNAVGKGVIIVDDDAVWHRKQDDEDEPEDEGDQPAVIEDAEVKQMHRMDALKTYRPYLSMADDGSGWVTVEDDESLGTCDNSTITRSPQGKSADFSAKRKRSDSTDLSPPTKRKDSANLSPPKRRKDSPDLSPPRRRKNSSDLSLPRTRNDFSAEEKPVIVFANGKRMDSRGLSHPRRRKGSPNVPGWKGVSSDVLDSLRRLKYSSSSGPEQEARDSSPPEERKHSNLSPRRRRFDHPPQCGEFRDVSTKRNGCDSPEPSPLRRRKDSVDLYSPGRSNMSSAEDSRMTKVAQDLSPPWKRRDSPDFTSLRRSRNSLDLLPPPRRRDSPDLSPPRRRSDSCERKLVVTNSFQSRKPQHPTAAAVRLEDLSPPRKKGPARMSDGTFAGLEKRPDREVVSEGELKRAAEAKLLSELDPSLSGRGAETVFRDKRGRRLDGLEEVLRQQRGEKGKAAEQLLEWGKGLAQKKVADQNLADFEAEKSKPFARYRDDAELDESLKGQLRWGDPMAHLVKQTTAENILEDLGEREEMKASGFIVPQGIPKHSWLKRGIAPSSNRYDIRPGRHWDGVNRSTGFEQGLFKQKNEKKARELEAYIWSVSDM